MESQQDSHNTIQPKGNGVVEQNNRSLGKSLHALLLGVSQNEWDDLLPHIMRVHRALPSTSTGETPNMLMLGRELRIPDQVTFYSPPTQLPTSEYVTQMLTRLEKIIPCFAMNKGKPDKQIQMNLPCFKQETRSG